MANRHHKPEEIVAKPQQIEVLVGQGVALSDASTTQPRVVRNARSAPEGAA